MNHNETPHYSYIGSRFLITFLFHGRGAYPGTEEEKKCF